MTKSAPITVLLNRWRTGDEKMLEQIIPAVYDELHRVARSYMRGEPAHHTHQATSLINEAFCRLNSVKSEINDRGHFIRIVANVMRQILVDHARANATYERGNNVAPISLDDVDIPSWTPSNDVIALEEILEAVGKKDPRKVEIAQLHYYCGMTYKETAKTLNLSPTTVQRELRLLKALLFGKLEVPA